MEEAMPIIARAFLIGYVFLLFLSGCVVTEEAYREKEIETQDLRDQLISLKKESISLQDREEELGKRLARVEVENDFLKQDRVKLERRNAAILVEKAKLERLLALFKEAKNGKVSKTNKAILDLEGQIKTLKKKLKVMAADKEAIEKNVRFLDRENQSLKTMIESEKYFKEQRLKEVSSTYESLIKDMEKEINKGHVIISELKGKLTVQMLNEILFDSGSTRIKEEGLEALKKVGKVLKEVKGREIRIEGHTDSTSIGPTLKRRFPSNWELSAARATSVVRYLQKEVGIDPSIMSATGYGPYKPAASNDTPEGRAGNRRIEIILTPTGAAGGSP
jgi:chemotaxis protein MotB